MVLSVRKASLKLELRSRYRGEGADEIVFYDITASPDGRSVDRLWINRVAGILDIPFCVAGGIRSVRDAEAVLNFALGGRYELRPDWTINLGFYTDGSPVGDPASTVLRKVDMWGVTFGSELRIGPLSGALGLAWSSGKSNPSSIGSILGGRIVETEVTVTSLRVNYALSYAF